MNYIYAPLIGCFVHFLRAAESLSRLLLCTLCAFAGIAAHSASTIRWTAHTTQDGLPNGSINYIYEDSYGMLWLGTWDGLCRYDGRTKVVYRHATTSPTSLSHPVVRHITEDRRGHLWVTTDMGINRLDLESGKFSSYHLDYGYNYVLRERGFFCDASPEGTVVAACRGGVLFAYNDNAGTFVRMTTGNAFPSSFSNLFFDAKGFLWVRSGDYLLKMSMKERAISVAARILLPETDSEQVHYDGDHRIWMSSGHQLWYVDTNAAHDAHPKAVNTHTALQGTLASVDTQRKGGTIVGTSSGAYSYTEGQPLTPVTTQTMSVLCVHQGAQQTLWLGTDGQGLMQRYTSRQFTRHYGNISAAGQSFFPIRAMLRSGSAFYAGSKGGGLMALGAGPGSGIVRQVEGTGSGAMASIYALAPWHGGILVGTDGAGLHRMNADGTGLAPMPCPDGSTTARFGAVYAILCDADGTIYIGTSGNGLYRLRTDRTGRIVSVSNFRHSPSNSNSISSDIIYSLQTDGQYLWIATRGGGLCRMDKRQEVFEAFMYDAQAPSSICSNDIIALHLERNGRLWIGTTEGVSVLQGGIFTTISSHDGLPADNIHAILDDRSGRIWVSTSRGIARIDAKTLQVTPYPAHDKDSDNEYADGAAYADAEGGCLFFGGNSGIDEVRTKEVGTSDFMPRLLLSGAEWPERSGGIVTDAIIRCRHDEMPLTLHFSILDFTENERCQFQYYLGEKSLRPEQLDDRWTTLSEGRSLTLNNLSAGTYRLYVRCSNSENVWSEPQLYTISVAPPWWRSWWAWAFYAAMMIYAGITFYRYKQRQLIAHHQREMEREHQLNKELTHQAKLRFFTNVAHEYSDSITLIYNAVGQLLAMGKQSAREQRQLETIHRNAERMLGQIEDLMDFRKAETGHLEIKVSRFRVADLIYATADSFLDTIDKRGIDFHLHIMPDTGEWVTDRGKVEKIIFNLLSSAIRHAPDGGVVKMMARREGEQLVVSCSNSGEGIPADKIGDVFNRITVLENFEQQLSHGIKSMGGIGMALCHDLAQLMSGSMEAESTPGVMTTFTLRLPMLEEDLAALPSKASDRVTTDEDRAFMTRAVEVLARHYMDEDFNKDAWASELALSRMQLYRKLQAIVQMPPSTFIRSYRMQQAAERLLHTGMNVQEIAYACGYRNRSNFHRAFQQEYGCSPLEYRSLSPRPPR